LIVASYVLESLEARFLLSAFTPAQIRHAFGFDKTWWSGQGQTIAIVDAYDDPNIAQDLRAFDHQFGLPDTDAAGAFALTKAMPQGAPHADGGWGQEISLDVEWAHAIAPGAHILLVEAKSASLNDLLATVDYARSHLDVSAVSVSWGSTEFAAEASLDWHFTTPQYHRGVTFVAAAGDEGAPPEWPAASPNVLSVGGTSLRINPDGSYASESAWYDSGGGVSRYEPRPWYQSWINTTHRVGPDVAFDADSSTGLYVYDSYAYDGQAGWFQFGGTSAGVPVWAATIAVANQGRQVAGKPRLDVPTQSLPEIYTFGWSDFHDVSTGFNNFYAAAPGWDPITGRGSPVAEHLLPDLASWNS
jgi:subtilase family serine protease